MAKTVDVAAGQQVATPWGNEIRDRTVQVFATVAERDAQWTAPPNGAMCVTLDTSTLWRRAKGVWQGATPFLATGEGAVTTDGFGIWTIGLPTGAACITGVANGAQNLPFFMVRDSPDYPAGNPICGWRAFNDAGGTPNNTTIVACWIITYHF